MTLLRHHHNRGSPAPLPVLTSITVTPASPTVVVGDTRQFTATAYDQNGSVMGGVVFSWTSSNGAAATVNSSGLATGVAAGSATITATSGAVSGSTTATVAAQVVTTVAVSPSTATITDTGSVQLSATAYDQVGHAMTGVTFAWSSGNTSYATVNSSGLVSGVAKGSVVITATASGQSGTCQLTVTQSASVVTTITVSPPTASFQAGTTQQFTATAYDQYSAVMAGVTFTWSSSNTGIATVDSTGLATGVAAGSATITASASGKSGTATATVTSAAVAGTFYASPTGAAGNAGTLASPWDLATVLQGGPTQTEIVAGSTVYLRGGEYGAGLTINVGDLAEWFLTVSGSAGNPIKFINYAGEHPKLNGGLEVSASYVWVQGLEIYANYNVRTTTQSGSWPNAAPDPIATYQMSVKLTSTAVGSKLINCYIHDMGGGIGQDDGATGAEIYGCIIYNNGWTGSDRPHGDGMYCQNSDTVNQVLVQNNIVWGNYEMGGQVYGSIAIVNYKIDSNISMYNGGFEWTLGGGDTSKQFIFTHNFCAKQSPWWNTTVFLGFNNNQNLDIDFGYNTILGYTEVNVWTQANIHNNNFLGTDMVMRYYKPASGDVSTMDYNYYEYQIPDGGYNPFEQMDSTGAQVGVYATLADWQTAMGFDLHSTENARPVAYSMARSAVYPNAYDSTRAHVVAVNAAGAASAAVDVSSFLTAGDIYHIYSAFNPLGAALATGTYGGGTLNFPLASQPMVQPIGDPSHWTAPDNTFGAYILIKG